MSTTQSVVTSPSWMAPVVETDLEVHGQPLGVDMDMSGDLTTDDLGTTKKPVIQRLKGPRKVTSGSSMTLRCKAKAKPNASYTWFHNGKEVTDRRGRRIKTSKRGSRLKISRASEDDAGEYECRASNARGVASKTVTVRVWGSMPSLYSANLQRQYMNEDANASYNYGPVTVLEQIHKPCEKQTFCFNGGSCRYLPDLQQTFCQCPKRWAGHRCELLDPLSVGLDPDTLHREAAMWYERTLIIVGIVIAALVFVVICIASYFLAKRRRKRWETRRRMKQSLAAEKDRLLKQTDGAHFPSYRPHHTKETQTDIDIQPPDLSPHRARDNTPNFIHAMPNNLDSSFHMDRHFPIISSAAASTVISSPPHNSNAHRPARSGSGKELERRGSRSRLKAVSVDDSCKDRPPSWKGPSDGHDSQAMPLLEDTDRNNPELIEMNDLNPHTSHSPNTSKMNGIPEFLSTFSSPELMAVPIKLEKQPQDNAHAQLKTPEEADSSSLQPANRSPRDAKIELAGLQGMDCPDSKCDEPQPLRGNPMQPGQSPLLPVNGVLEGSAGESDEEQTALSPLYISEEDLNGNLSKAESLDSGCAPVAPPRQQSADETSSPTTSCPSPPLSFAAYRPKDLPTVLIDGMHVPPSGRAPGSASEDDSGGFLPQTVSSTEASSPFTEDTPQGDTYAFDPGMESDPNDFDEQFMHGSPRKSPGGFSEAEIQKDYERRLRNVRSDQEPIPI